MSRIILIIFFSFFGAAFVLAQSSITNYLNGEHIRSISVDENKKLYISAADTTYYFDGLNFLNSDYKQSNADKQIASIENQLAVKDEYGLSSSVMTAAPVSDERIVFTNKTSRLYQLYDGKILRYLIPDLEEQNLIINKLVGSGDYLLICTLNDGLYIWKHKEFVLDKLNYSHDLKTNDINDALLDDWGNLWIATDDGLQKLKYIDKSSKSVPHVTIDKINVLYDEVSKEDLELLDESQNSLQFQYSARDYSGNGGLIYEWRMDGSDNWHTIEDEVVSLSSLSPGNYKFELRASNGNGLYGYALPVNFTIMSSSFSAGWKYVLGGVSLLSLLWIWSFSRYNKSVRNFETEKKKLKLQNELLKTEQKALQLQMNPHFVFNALNSIQGLIATNENQAARKYLNKFSTMMRSMLDQSRGEAISIDKEIKYLDDYLSLERMGREDKFDFEVSKSEEVPDVKIPSMLIQPFVENAIVHGMKGLDRKGLITVNFKMEEDELICVIEDNGVGRKTATKDDEHQSLGMQVVKDRLSKYSRFKNYKHLEIIDKTNDDGTNAGTKINIKLPQL